MDTPLYDNPPHAEPLVIEYDRHRTRGLIWIWRNAWRRMLPPGLVVFPFNNYPTLVYFWNAGASASGRWVAMAWLLTAALAAGDVWLYLGASTVAPPWFVENLPEVRLLALPLYMVLAAVAVVARFRWWRRGGRLDELLVTFLDGRDILPVLWTPAAVRVMTIYGMGWIVHVVLAGQWPTLWEQWLAWYQTPAPPHLLLALLEFLLALLLMRAAITCSLFGAIRSRTSAGITGRAMISALEYILLAVSGSVIYLFVLGMLSFMALALGVPILVYFAVVLMSVGAMGFLRHLRMDSLEDYHEFLHEWRRHLSR